MPNYNKVILIGHLTRDPELKPIGDSHVCNFTIAVNRTWKDKAGEKKESVSFIDCKLWGKGGETFAQYMAKGRAALVEGSIEQESWQSKDGEKRSKLTVRVDSFTFVGGKGDGGKQAVGAAASGGGEEPPF